MKRPAKKDIKAAVDALKTGPNGEKGGNSGPQSEFGQLTEKKSSKRIRKQGV